LERVAALKWTTATTRGEPRIVLTLGGAGGVIDGTVSQRSGAPIEGAEVAVGRLREDAEDRETEDGLSVDRTPPPVIVRSDGEGRFRVEGVGPGPTPVVARAPGFAPAVVEANVDPETPAFVDLGLESGATLAGVVRNPDGSPAAGLKVSLTSGASEL